MRILGIIVLLAGAAGAGLTYTGNTELLGPLSAFPKGLWGGVLAVGAVLTYLGRRPGD
jgi:hypothetical protein